MIFITQNNSNNFMCWFSCSMSSLGFNSNQKWPLLHNINFNQSSFWGRIIQLRKQTWFPFWCWSSAIYLYEWDGTTRSSWSAVASNTYGYSAPFLIVCNGEYLKNTLIKKKILCWNIFFPSILDHVFKIFVFLGAAVIGHPVGTDGKLVKSQHVAHTFSNKDIKRLSLYM